MKVLASLLFFFWLCAAADAYTAPYTCSANFFVATTGLDSATCGTAGAPCATMHGADAATSIGGLGRTLQAGDCVNYASGTYSMATGVSLAHGGNANSAAGYVVHKSTTQGGAVFRWANAAVSGTAIVLGTSYLILDGFEFNGNITNTGVNTYVQGIISGTAQTTTNPHHFMILNSLVHDFGGEGILIQSTDYVIIAGNTVYNNASTSPYHTNGLVITDAEQLPAFTASLTWDTQHYHIQVLDNIVHDNQEGGTVTGHLNGNGIVLYDFRNAFWTGGPGAYPYNALVAGNASYHNGGAGIFSNSSIGIDFFNNTNYNNGQDAAVVGIGEFSCGVCTNTRIYNTIGYSTLAAQPAIKWTGTPDTGNVWNNDETYNSAAAGNSVTVTGTSNDAGNLAAITTGSANNVLGTNPNFVSTVTPDFHLQAGSAASATGTITPLASGYSILTPDGFNQPTPPNIGAYNLATGTLTPCSTSVECFQYVAGNYYIPDLVYTSYGSTIPATPNVIRCVPAGWRSKATVSQIQARIYRIDAAGHVQFGVYTNGTDMRPAALVATSPSMSTSAAGVITGNLSANIQGGPNGANFADTFYVCFNTDSSAVTLGAVNITGPLGPSIIGSPNAGDVLEIAGPGSVVSHLSCSGSNCHGGSSTYGTFPASLAGSTWTVATSALMPAMALKVLSVP